MTKDAILFGEHFAALFLKATTVTAGAVWFSWHAVTVLAQSMPAPEVAGNLAVTAGSTGAIVGVLYWAINRIDRLVKEEREAREENEERREAKWMAHDTKRDDTLRLIADKTGGALDRCSEAFARNDTNIRRCEERQARDERKATG